jgi:hypothetical protein
MSSKFYFMSRVELNSYNRVNSAPGARQPDKKDYQRVRSMLARVGDRPLRAESGSAVVPSRWNPNDSDDMGNDTDSE